MDGIEIAVDHVGLLSDIALFRVWGYVDTTTSPQLQKIITENIEHGYSQFIIDLGSVNYVSSAGWGVFVGEIQGLREKGGDLKIIQMNPEVIEVFEMLEFNRILTCYDSLDEAIDEYDFCRGLDLKTALPITLQPAPDQQNDTFWRKDSVLPANATLAASGFQNVPRLNSPQRGRPIDEIDLPLTEKLKKLIVENPLMGPWALKKQLYSPRFGYTKVGYFKVRNILKRLGLDSKTKRYRYYRSR
jgi:anti-sigma B factor antagonist